ncbi:zinc-dependent alcohol dehydrogenase family protein [Gluconobacter thailandicus]|nr:NAD(P)-dependent alcohol dehydrogenase [Gluconobacter thailandicus]
MQFYEFPTLGNISKLMLRSGEIPEPGRRQVLVRMRACSLNYRDLMICRNEFPPAKSSNLVPLCDGVGEVVALGDDVTRHKIGDRVAGLFFQEWENGPLTERALGTALGGPLDGVLTEYRVFEEGGLIGFPDHLSFHAAATLPCAAVTAWHALFCGSRTLTPGQHVLVLGTGGVSVFALQFALLAGAHVTAISSSDEKISRLQEMGAHSTLNYWDTPKWGDIIARQGGADHVIEVGGSGTLSNSMTACR